jgi:hypothetical protein
VKKQARRTRGERQWYTYKRKGVEYHLPGHKVILHRPYLNMRDRQFNALKHEWVPVKHRYVPPSTCKAWIVGGYRWKQHSGQGIIVVLLPNGKLKQVQGLCDITSPYYARWQKHEAILEVQLERTLRIMARMGEEGNDDRIRTRNPVMVASSPEGIIIVNSFFNAQLSAAMQTAPYSQDVYRRFSFRGIIGAEKPTHCAVVVSCPSTGHRHELSIPPEEFGTNDGKFKDDAEWVHAAIAWTFGMTPEEYQPGFQS